MDYIFGVMVLLPSILLAFVILATFYGWANAYASISWIPIVLFLAVRIFFPDGFGVIGQKPDMNMLIQSIGWASFVQGIIGIVLVARAFAKSEDWLFPALATILTALPFLLMAWYPAS